MKKCTLVMIILILLIFSNTKGYSSFINNLEKQKIFHDNIIENFKDPDIIIPDDYPTIQEGINNANIGDLIFVRTGIYKESIIIDKQNIFLKGENKYTTIIDGNNTENDGITIKAENIFIEGFTVTNFRKDELKFWQQAGIKIYSSNTSINDNCIISNRIGIEVYSQVYNITISNNQLTNDSILIGNYFNSDKYPNITILDFIHKIENNTVNGIPLYYYKDKNDFTISTSAGQIILVNCTNVIVKDLNMSHNDFPIILAYCSKCLLENLTITESDGEILLFQCENNTIQNNSISRIFKGVCLEYKSRNNVIRYNDFSNNYVGISVYISANNNSIYRNKVNNNDFYGIEIVSYHGGFQLNNNISDNEISNNKNGIFLYENSIENIIQNNSIFKNNIGILLEKSSNYNLIKYNNFKMNDIQATFIGCTKNVWYKNYWSRPRFLPKIIIGFLTIGKIPIPWINFDLYPVKRPYEILDLDQ